MATSAKVDADDLVRIPPSLDPRQPTPPKGTTKAGLLKSLGPGLVTGASDDDPSGIATYSQVGAQFGFGMLWVMLFSYPLMCGIQEISGVARGNARSTEEVERAVREQTEITAQMTALAQELGNLSVELRSIVSRFKLE